MSAGQKRPFPNGNYKQDSSQLPLPPRWLKCPRKGLPIIDTFIPFKTPLDSKYDDQVPEEDRFTYDFFVNSLAAWRIKLGLAIDSTNTTRWYDSKILEEKAIKYVKINSKGSTKGRTETPNEDQTTTFIKVCSNFIAQNPLLHVGVHCTHGFNRTGFLIAAYLVEKHDWSVDAAVQSTSLQPWVAVLKDFPSRPNSSSSTTTRPPRGIVPIVTIDTSSPRPPDDVIVVGGQGCVGDPSLDHPSSSSFSDNTDFLRVNAARLARSNSVSSNLSPCGLPEVDISPQLPDFTIRRKSGAAEKNDAESNDVAIKGQTPRRRLSLPRWRFFSSGSGGGGFDYAS